MSRGSGARGRGGAASPRLPRKRGDSLDLEEELVVHEVADFQSPEAGWTAFREVALHFGHHRMRDRSWLEGRYVTFAATLAWAALALQFLLTTGRGLLRGLGLVGSVAVFLDYFTILTNILAALALSAPAVWPRSRLAAILGRPAVLGAIVTYIAVVGIIYSLLLQHLRPASGPWLWADVALHDIAPVLFVIYWLLFAPKGWLRWKHAVFWLAYPACYVAYAFLRAGMTGRYPYHFIDVAAVGWPRVVVNMAVLLIGFLAVGLVFVAIDRLLGGRRAQRAEPTA